MPTKPVFLILTCLIILIVAAQPVAAQDGSDPITSGLVDIGGYKLFIDCQGEGSPTVVMDAGMGDTGRSWLRVQSKIARFTRVCTYDRAGLGGSDPSPITPRTSRVMAEELHMLLHNAHLEGPYVLVAHSFGGYNVRLFAHLYPDEVVGMVLVQTGHEDQDFGDGEQVDRDVIAFGNREGMTVGEWLDSKAEVRATRSEDDTPELGDLPLVVLTATNYPPPLWPMQQQEDLATLSSNSTHIIAEESGHYIHNDQPDLVIDAVQQVVDAARQVDAAPAQTVITSGLVDIGGYKLFIDCQGEGSPTVVMDAGLALTGRSWILVQPKIARFTRVCTYDRAGLGGSDPSPITPRTSQVVADELYALLTNAGIEGPYVLVGHSSGGFCVRLFAHDHPDRVAGMVLVDTPHEDLYLRLEEVLPEYVEWLRGLTNAEGVDFSSNLEEVQAIRPADGSPELGDKPLVVLVAGSPNAWAGLSDEEAALFLGIMRELQADLVTLSTNSVFTVADEASHLVQRDRPDRVVEAVQQVVDAARTGDPLE